jgi:hypothetical protein
VVRALSPRRARGPHPVAAGFMDRLSLLISTTPKNCANADPDVSTAWSQIVIPLAISQREKDHGPGLRASRIPDTVRGRTDGMDDDM